MKYPVWPDTTASEIPAEINEIHLVRPMRSARLLDLISRKKIRKIFLSKSCLSRMSKKTTGRLKEKNVELSLGEARGRPLNISFEKIKEVLELRKDYQSLRKIEKLTGVPKSTIHYLIKYASRQKVRGGKKVIYL